MKFTSFGIIFFVLITACASVGKPSRNVLSASALQPVGRYIKDDRGLQMVSSGMYTGFSFEGAQCTVYVSSPGQHNYLQYELDGVYQKRVRISGNKAQPVIIAAGEKGEHRVWLFKATEAHTGPLIIESIEGQNLKALPVTPKKSIEFIGNSITCGAAADLSEVPCGAGAYHDQHNAYMAYGPRVARALNTHYMLSSVSGIGIYRNWNSDGPSMPQVYEKTNFQPDGPQWNFSRYQPDIVSIALGTNDFSNGDGVRPRLPFDSARFVQQYIQFVQRVKNYYPQAQVALLSSPMVHGGRNQLLQNCLMAVKKAVDANYPQQQPVALFFFTHMQARGCTGHPSVADHAILAEEALPFFKKLLMYEKENVSKP